MHLTILWRCVVSAQRDNEDDEELINEKGEKVRHVVKK